MTEANYTADQYLIDSGKTESYNVLEDTKIPEWQWGNTAEFVYNLVDLVYFGTVADLMKRSIFYKSPRESIETRNVTLSEGLADLGLKAQALLANADDIDRPLGEDKVRLLHAALGLISEAGEIVEEVINSHIEHRPVNVDNMKEEFGDVSWYLALGLRVVNTSFYQVMKSNIAKLTARYPNKFNTQDAENRNLEAEKVALTQ